MKLVLATLLLALLLMLAPNAVACHGQEGQGIGGFLDSRHEELNQTLQDRSPYPHCMPFAETTPNPPFIHFFDHCMCPTPDGSSILCEFLP